MLRVRSCPHTIVCSLHLPHGAPGARKHQMLDAKHSFPYRSESLFSVGLAAREQNIVTLAKVQREDLVNRRWEQIDSRASKHVLRP